MIWEKMEDTNKIIDFVSKVCPNAILADGFNDCIIGVSISVPNNTNVVYSTRKIIQKLMKKDKMGYFDALEYFEYNIEGACFDNSITPVYYNDMVNPNLN
jgi:hypothetical protein